MTSRPDLVRTPNSDGGAEEPAKFPRTLKEAAKYLGTKMFPALCFGNRIQIPFDKMTRSIHNI